MRTGIFERVRSYKSQTDFHYSQTDLHRTHFVLRWLINICKPTNKRRHLHFCSNGIGRNNYKPTKTTLSCQQRQPLLRQQDYRSFNEAAKRVQMLTNKIDLLGRPRGQKERQSSAAFVHTTGGDGSVVSRPVAVGPGWTGVMGGAVTEIL